MNKDQGKRETGLSLPTGAKGGRLRSTQAARTAQLLEDLARQLGITVRHLKFAPGETLSRGGLCKIRGNYVLFLDSQFRPTEKIPMLIEALQRFDLTGLPLPEEVARFFDPPAPLS